MPRSREELVEAAREEARRRTLGHDVTSLLTELADLLDSLEERGIEYRAAGADGEDRYVTVPQYDRDSTRRVAERLDLSLQRRTVFSTPWTDVEEGTDGC